MIDVSGEPKGKFWSALDESEIGGSIVYHVGQHCGGPHRIDAMDAYDRGLVTLVQSRGGPGMFIYIAQKLNPKRKKK